ncbi:MAG: ribonuclease HI [Candidatus Paceibacterota bacterium]|jgi:ribonuclease HI
MIKIYTDGSSRGNPGPGGYGAIIINDSKSEILNPKSEIIEIGGREEMTTNNRMEMVAAIEGLKNIPENYEVEIYSDSAYLIGGITIWINNWQKNNWRTKDKREVLNKDLWQALLIETEKRKVEWQKVAGHSGHELNDRCDDIATSFADNKNVSLYNGSKQGYILFH